MVFLQHATENDCQFIYDVRFHPEIRKYMVDQNVPSYGKHKTWYYENFHKNMYIIMLNDIKIGYVKTDENRENDISIAILPIYQNKGYGTEAIKLFLGLNPDFTVQIKKMNIPSQQLFNKFDKPFIILDD